MDFLSEKLQGISSAYASRSHTNPFHNLFSSSPTTQDPFLSALGLDSSPSLILILDPPLPPFLQPLPSIFRALSVIVLLPIFLICVVDFAGYAVFRTLGVHRRRVRVKRNPALSVQESTTSPSRSAALSTTLPFPASAGSKAPLLSPGSYDAQELLRHRARSASGASDADLDWIRTGGSFARVTNVRAAAAAAAAANANSPSSVKHPDVGVEGALGLLDTDVEDSGTESGRTSPINTFGRDSSGRPKIRKGLGGSFFGFTPMDNKNEEDSRSIQAGGASGPPSPNSENPTSNQLGAHAANLSESLSSLTSTKSAAGVSVNSSSNDTNGSWVGINQEEIASRDIAAASDLEPPHRPSLYRAES